MDDPNNAVFLSYTSQDVEVARRICDALRAAGIEVWFDQSELRGGDVWDAAIRTQIKACRLFVPIISRNTDTRSEGYFRLEWKLAIDRSHLMASNRAFLLPIVIDETKAARTNVPDRFREVQWISLPGGEPTADLLERVKLLLARETLPEIETQLPAAEERDAIPTTSHRLKTPLRRSLWLAALAIGVLVGVGWMIRHQFAAAAQIVPYSLEDRRMTFALLPLQPAADDATAVQIARATGAELYTTLEDNHVWVNLAPQDSVARAFTKSTVPRDLAKALHVHFLIRGNVTSAPSGYAVALFVVDGETEHVLGSADLPIQPNALTPRWKDDVVNALGFLIYYGLQVEVERARSKPVAALDVRDLTFRAYVDWGRARMAHDDKGAYDAANSLLKRALTLAPDDPLALSITARVNLCDCIEGWSTNPAVQQAIGEAAVDKYLTTHPDSTGMLQRKADLFFLRGRYEESLLLLDKVLAREPENFDAMEDKARLLLKLGRAKEAAALAAPVYVRHPDDWPEIAALTAAIDYTLADYTNAEQYAKKAVTQYDKLQLSNPNLGAVRLTLIAAAGQLHDTATAGAGISDLKESAPGLKSIADIRKWIHPQADLYGYEPLFDGLRLAGFKD